MENNIQNFFFNDTATTEIYTIRGQKVMLDFDLAAMYGVKTGRLNEQVKRNIERFPEDFMFQLTKGELEILRSQIVISKMPENQVDGNMKSQNATSNLADNQHDSILISQIATSNNASSPERSQIVTINKRADIRCGRTSPTFWRISGYSAQPE